MPGELAVAPRDGRVETGGVTVVIPHFGPPKPTLALIGALLRQTYSGRIELVVVDDVSPEPFPDTEGVIVVRRGRNGGFGSAVNSGVAVASEPMLLILNSDLEIADDFVERLVRDSSSWMPAIVGPRMMTPDGDLGYSARLFPTAAQHFVEWLVPLARWRGQPALHRAVGHDMNCVGTDVRPTDWLVGAVLLLPTATFRSVGGFDECFYMNSEEVDLQRRLRAQGVPSIYVGTVDVLHEGGGSSDSNKRLRWIVESRRRYAAKWGSERQLQITLTIATVINFVWNSVRKFAGRPLDPIGDARAHLTMILANGEEQ